MRNNTTHYAIILDRSGSMKDCKNQAISSFNEQLGTIKGLQKEFPEQDFTLTLATFNDRVNLLYSAEKPKRINKLNSLTYRPSGTTALYDAIGMTVNSLQKNIGDEISNKQANAVIVIITDGYENSSNRYNYQSICDLIKELESTGNYTFSYLGATLDAVEIAESLNINSDNAMYFDKQYYSESTEILNNSYKEMANLKREGASNYNNFLKK